MRRDRKLLRTRMGPARHGRELALPAMPLGAGYAQRSATAQAAITARCTPTCRDMAVPTEGWKSALVVGMRFFGGVVSVGAAKPLDGRGWRGVFQVGGQL